MKKVFCLLVIILFSFSLSIGQTKGKATVRKPVKVSQLAEAEKAWPSYWQKFRRAVITNNKTELRDLMYRDIGCPWGYLVNQDPRDGCLEHFETKSSYKSVNDLGYSLRQVVKPGGWAKIKGASYKLFKTNSIYDRMPVVSRSIHCVDRSDCSAQFDFEFRNQTWQWSYFASGCD